MSILGTKLKQVRESKGIPLDIIYHHTKISPDNLRLLESNQLENIPKTYLNAFIKSYGKEIGLSESFIREAITYQHDDELLELLFSGDHEAFQQQAAEKKSVKHNKLSESEIENRNKLASSNNMISEKFESVYHRYKKSALGVVVLALVVFLIYNLTKSERPQSTTVQAIPFEQVVDSVLKSQAATEKITVQSKPTLPDIKKGMVRTLFIRATTESCYVQINYPDTTGKPNMIDFIIPPGRGIIRKGEYFDVKIGRAQAVEVFLDNQKLLLPKTNGLIPNWRVDEKLLKN